MASDSLESFPSRMTALAEGVHNAVVATTVDAARFALYEVVLATPIDVGTARSNWKVTVGGPFVGTRQPAFRPFPSRWASPAGRGGTMGDRSNLVGAMQQAMVKLKGWKGEGDIYISNILPYIAPLNAGHSPMAEAGFIARAVAVAGDQVNAAAEANLNREVG